MAQASKWHSYDDMQAEGTTEVNSSAIIWFEATAIALALIIIVFVFCVRVVIVIGPSMESTLMNNDRVVVQSFLYTPKRGDVVVVDSYTKYGKPLVKRIIAIEGDTISINGASGEVILNGEVLNEPYISSPTTLENATELSLTIPEGSVFVMGDNRARSLDSRSNEIGIIDHRDILGKILLRIYPFSSIGVLNG